MVSDYFLLFVIAYSRHSCPNLRAFSDLQVRPLPLGMPYDSGAIRCQVVIKVGLWYTVNAQVQHRSSYMHDLIRSEVDLSLSVQHA